MDIPAEVCEEIVARRKSDSLHPSACHSDACMRQEMYRLKGYTPAPQSEEEAWRLMAYTLYQEYITRMMMQKHPFARDEVPVKLEHWSGKLDLLLDPDRGPIVEVKSINPWGLKYELPQSHHVEQLLVYMAIVESINEEFDLQFPNYAYLVYIERWLERPSFKPEWLPELHPSCYDGVVSEPGRGKPAIVQFTISPTQLDETRARMWEMESWLSSEELPPRPYSTPTEHPWNCMAQDRKTKEYEPRCPYLDVCWGLPF